MWRYQIVTSNPTLEERACAELAHLLSPGMLARGAAAAAVGEWRNTPVIDHQDLDEMSHRFAAFYARHSAQATGEMLAGYLHHENPLKQTSGLHGTWSRVGAALLTVVQTTDPDGSTRPAFAPLAGAFSSGLTSMACYRYRGDTNLDGVLKHSGAVYSSYFVNAIFREFKPDLTSLAYRATHHKH